MRIHSAGNKDGQSSEKHKGCLQFLPVVTHALALQTTQPHLGAPLHLFLVLLGLNFCPCNAFPGFCVPLSIFDTLSSHRAYLSSLVTWAHANLSFQEMQY